MSQFVAQILTRDDGDKKDHSGVLRVLCQSLLDLDLLKHTLSAPHDWDATDAKFMGLCSLPGGKMRHIDILCVPADELGAALICGLSIMCDSDHD